MRTEASVRSEVVLAVLDDRDRSLEGAVERAVRAGIELERERIRAILDLSVPPGLEKALIALALHPATTVDAAADFIATWPTDPSHSATLRATMKLVRSSENVKGSDHAR